MELKQLLGKFGLFQISFHSHLFVCGSVWFESERHLAACVTCALMANCGGFAAYMFCVFFFFFQYFVIFS